MKLADYSQAVTVDQLDAALRAGGFEGVFHYLAGTPGFALRIEDPQVVDGIRSRGWPQLGIDIPRTPADVAGAATAGRASQVYGFGPGLRIFLDIEPAQFNLDPVGWPSAADRWCDEIRAAGFSPGVYGTDVTVAACANHADAIWRAVPGECDPAGPGLDPAFFAGRRAIQCATTVAGGVEFDVSFSQFPAAAPPPAPGPAPAPMEDEEMLMITPVDASGNPTGPGFLLSGALVVDIPDQASTDGLASAGVQIAKVPAAFASAIRAASAAFHPTPGAVALAHTHAFTGSTSGSTGTGTAAPTGG
jgi:hypothetical protein